MNVEEYALRKVSNLSQSFKFFNREIISDAYGEEYKIAPHTDKWADILQFNKRAAILSARLHLKSTTLYHYLAWELLRNPQRDIEVLYLSYKSDMAQYHTKKIKELIKRHPLFQDYKDMTTAEGILKFSIDEVHKFTVEPEGILSFKRGRHPDIVICDDILADPSQELNLQIINKITRIVFEDVMNLPKKEGKLFIAGTSAHQEDVFFQIKKKALDFNWSEWKAITNEITHEVLWKEQFPYDWLIQKRKQNEKAFNKEFMCSPVYSEDAFFTRDQLNKIIDTELKKTVSYEGDLDILAGLDIGKHAHPSHFAVFKKENNVYTELYHEFFDNVDYKDQVKRINELIGTLRIDKVYFDNTRNEFEPFLEQGIIDKNIWVPEVFSLKRKNFLAHNFFTLATNERIKLINDDRQFQSILAVNNDLDALESSEGHGDAFWSISLAVQEKAPMQGGILTNFDL